MGFSVGSDAVLRKHDGRMVSCRVLKRRLWFALVFWRVEHYDANGQYTHTYPKTRWVRLSRLVDPGLLR